jgi:hypothetical protein
MIAERSGSVPTAHHRRARQTPGIPQPAADPVLKALGIDVPTSILLRADEVIE